MSDLEQRIRERAFRIWLEEGRPEGREVKHWDMATELVAIEDGQKSTDHGLDTGEPIEAGQNAGEAPTLTDQGEGRYPERHSRKQRSQN